MSCVACKGADISVLFSFGKIPVSGYLEENIENAINANVYKNVLCICESCKLVQQFDLTAKKELEDKVYSNYQSTYSMSEPLREYLDTYLNKAINFSKIKKTDSVVEIGSNDGGMLNKIEELGYQSFGFDPSAKNSNCNSIVIKDFFTTEAVLNFVDKYGKTKLVVSRHTMEHVFDVDDFLSAISIILDKNGTACIEVPYIYHQMISNQFQSMAHQHVSYFSISSMINICDIHNMSVVDCEFVSMDGGSIVFFISKKGEKLINRRVTLSKAYEDTLGLDRGEFYAEWHSTLRRSMDVFSEYISNMSQKTNIFAYGGGTKGQALLNMLHLDNSIIEVVLDDTDGVDGSFIPGTANTVKSSKKYTTKGGILVITAPTHSKSLIQKIKESDSISPDLIMVTAPFFKFV